MSFRRLFFKIQGLKPCPKYLDMNFFSKILECFGKIGTMANMMLERCVQAYTGSLQ
jgi:hypothetical protein